MRQGVALTDADRAGWLAQLGDVLQQHPAGAVLSCSALKRAYRDTLRRAGRPGHFYPPSLVTSQFDALQDPAGEAGVLTLDGAQALDEVAARAVGWLRPATDPRGPAGR